MESGHIREKQRWENIVYQGGGGFFALVCVFIFGWFPKTKHNELMFSGRMNVSLLYEMGHGNGLSACVMCGTVP